MRLGRPLYNMSWIKPPEQISSDFTEFGWWRRWSNDIAAGESVISARHSAFFVVGGCYSCHALESVDDKDYLVYLGDE